MGGYERLLRLLRRGSPEDAVEIKDDAERLLDAARARGRAAFAAATGALVWDLIAGALHDLTRALRMLIRRPAFALTASLLLGAGVAATTTLFALIYGVVVKPLPYPEPERLVTVWESNVSMTRVRDGAAPGNLQDWLADTNGPFERLTAWWASSATLSGRDGKAPVTGVQVTPGFFETFGRPPILGRFFAGDEYVGRPSIASGRIGGREPILVLSHHLWQSLGGDPALVGATVHIEGRSWRVLGVMPADFAVPDASAGFWTPWDVREAYRGARFPDGPPRDFRFLRAVGRLKPGVSVADASQRMETLAARLAADHPRTNAGWNVALVPLHDELIRSSRTALLLVFGAVSGLLLLVCANVATLSIARRVARARDTAVRMALGAGRARIIREHLAETALCAVLTAVAAIVFTASSLSAAVNFAPSDIPRLHEVDASGPVVLFAMALGLAAAMLGVGVPGLRVGTRGIASTLKDGAPVSRQQASRLRRGLVIAEIGVTVVLMVGAGLLVRSYARLHQVDLGFDVRNLLVLRLAPDVTRYDEAHLRNDYYRRVLDSIRDLAGVDSVAAVTVLPMSTVGSDFYRPYWPEGAKPDGSAVAQADVRMATPEYFATLGRPLVAGRDFSPSDDLGAGPVVIVNEALARSAWPDRDPVGRTLVLDYQGAPTQRRVIGVVRDARYDGPRSAPAPEVFIPHAQNPYLVMNVVARTTMNPDALIRAARSRALSVDPDQAVHSVTTMERLLGDTLQQDRFAMRFVGLFAAAGLVTAASGVYALLAFTVADRRREIAVRMAIGAPASSVVRLVVGESLMLAGLGCALGALGVAAASRAARAVLFGIAPQDPMTLAVTGAVLLATVLAASWLPARRATSIDPVSAMRV